MIRRIGKMSCPLLFSSLAVAQATLVVPTNHATIQAAIVAAVPGDTVLVLPGTYVERIDLLGKPITVRSAGGAAVTTIDGNQAGTVVTFANGEPPSCVLEGFTITNGLGATVVANGARALAGGIQCTNAAPTIRRCVVTGNTGGNGVNAAGALAAGPGGPGGMSATTSSLQLVDCEVSGNVGGFGGSSASGVFVIVGARGGAGGVHLDCQLPGAPQLLRCRLVGNQGGSGGAAFGFGQPTNGGKGGTGGIEVFTSIPLRLDDVVLANNHGGDGGAVTGFGSLNGGHGGNGGFDASAPLFGTAGLSMTNCAVVGNLGGNGSAGGPSHGGDGGGSTGGTAFTALSTTVAGNTAGLPLLAGAATGGLTLGGSMSSSMSLRNCIVWGNTRGGLPSDLYGVGLPVTANTCDIGASIGTLLGSGNLSVDPLFVDLPNGDVHLTAASPCRHTGSAAAVMPLFDLDRDPRTIGPATDIGADEFEALAGSREDFALSLAVNGAFAPDLAATPATGGDLVTVRVTSPGGTLAGAFALLVVEPWLPPIAPVGTPGLPELQVSLGAYWLDVYANGVGAGGATLSLPWPAGLAGFALRLQAIAVAPASANGVFAATAARDLIL